MTMQQLLFEDFGPIRFQIMESSGGVLVAEGEFGYCDRPTSNGRVYPRKIMEREFARLRPKMKAGGLFGELDHPEDGKTKLQRVAMRIDDMRIEADGRVVGRFRVLEGTPNGDTLAAIVRNGGQVGVSSRGIGSTVTEGNSSIVQEDFRLFGYDAVAEPAVSSALPSFEDRGADDGGRRARRGERRMAESARYLSDDEVADLLDEQDHGFDPSILSALVEHINTSQADQQDELRAVRQKLRETERLLASARDALVYESRECEELEAELAEAEARAEALAQSDALAKHTLWSATADTIVNQRLPAIHSEHREHFLRLLGKPAPGTSLADFERRVQVQFEEFTRTGRAVVLDADLVLEQRETLREAREQLLILSEQAVQNEQRGTLLAESSQSLRALAEQAELVPQLRRQLAVTQGELEALRSDHKKLMREHKRLAEDYAQVTDQVELIEERAQKLEEQSHQMQEQKLEIQRLKRSLSAQYPKQMYEHLKSARTSAEIKEEAEQFLRMSRRSTGGDPSGVRPAQFSGTGSNPEMGLTEQQQVLHRVRAMHEAKRNPVGSTIVESAHADSLQPPAMNGASHWDTPAPGSNNAVVNIMRRMNRSASQPSTNTRKT